MSDLCYCSDLLVDVWVCEGALVVSGWRVGVDGLGRGGDCGGVVGVRVGSCCWLAGWLYWWG